MGLFDEFNIVSHEDWLKQIEKDLKGKDFKDTLVWNSFEGIEVQPFYNKTSLADAVALNAVVSKKENGWRIRAAIFITTPEEANKKALAALKGGADSLLFLGDITSKSEMEVLLKDILVDIIDINFYTHQQKQVTELLENKITKGTISFDVLGELLVNGNWKIDQTTDLLKLYEVIQSPSAFKSILVKGGHFNNAGATIVQELAFSLSQGVEYLNLLSDLGSSAETIANNMHFSFGIGSNYFFEIAKIRAARILWKMILEQYNIDQPSDMIIHSETSNWNLTNLDANVNMLRVTTESMSAIIGGCDSLTATPYNTTFEQPNDFSERIARNVQIVLKEESFLDKVNNPSDGSYYIEQLTDEIAEKAWNLFQEVESKGGFLKCVINNFIQDEIRTIADQKRQALKNGEMVLVGVNKYQNKTEKKRSVIKQSENNIGKTLITPLNLFRAAESIEQDQLIVD